MNVAIITSGYLPVPASRGGAVETIVEGFIEENEKKKEVKFNIFSIYDEEAAETSKKYKNTSFCFIKTNRIVECLDKIIYHFAKTILKKEKTMSYRYILQRLYFLNKVSKKLKRENYDKIIIENHATLFLALKWRKNYKKYDGKYYYHIHNELVNSYGCAQIIKNTKKILCVSKFIKKQVIDFLELENENNVEVLTNCIDIHKFNGKISREEKNRLKKKYNIKSEEKVLLFTGRLTKEKGIKELLQAIEKVKNNHYKLLIVGSFFFRTDVKNDFKEELEELIQNVKDKVEFTGFIDYNEIPKIYAIADIAVLPSQCNDSAPLTIIESMASGLPIITTNSGGIPEYAKNGCAIIIQRDHDIVENMAKAIKDLLENSEQVNQMSRISYENAQELNLSNFYNNLITKIN